MSRAKGAEPRPVGRPTAYSEEVANEILRRMGDGETLTAICSEEGMPARSTVSLWSIKDEPPGFSARYDRARMLQALAIGEDALDIADNTKEEANSRRVRVDTRKWFASKMHPSKFGDSTALRVSDPDGKPLVFTFKLDKANHDGDDAGGG